MRLSYEMTSQNFSQLCQSAIGGSSRGKAIVEFMGVKGDWTVDFSSFLPLAVAMSDRKSRFKYTLYLFRLSIILFDCRLKYIISIMVMSFTLGMGMSPNTI